MQIDEPRTDFDTDVLIVGTGPMGATTALSLTDQGVRVHAVNKRNWLADTPRAHITNQRAVEVLRRLGVEDEVASRATPWNWMGDMPIATSFAGTEIARLRMWGTGEDRTSDYLTGSPCTPLDIPQPYLEPILINAAARGGAQISFNTEYLRHEQDAEGVTVSLKDRISGHEYTQRARYLVGADGGRSQVAEDIGLDFDGHTARGGHVYAEFRADLSSYAAHRPSILYYFVNPVGAVGEIGLGLLRMIRPWDHWVAGWGFDLADGPDLRPDNALTRIRALVGDPGFECEITSIAPWYVNQQSARTYSMGRVFCGGDAVHRHPPSSGLGSNTSIQDAFNLAWKLAHVIHGFATPEILDSYTAEREPVGRGVVARANQSRRDFAPLKAALDTAGAPDRAAAVVAKVRDTSAAGVRTRASIRDALALKNFEFNAQGTELNHRYRSTAVLADDHGAPEVWQRDPGLYLQATTRPGAKVPHAWLVNEHGRRISTLDIVSGSTYTVLTGLAGTAWVAAVQSLDLPYLRSAVIGAPAAADLYGDWAQRSEIAEAGAVLVRPDGVVAWRNSAAQYDPAAALELLAAALTRVHGVGVDAGNSADVAEPDHFPRPT